MIIAFSITSFIRPALGAEVKVFVALSFQGAFNELAASYEHKTKGVRIISKFGASQDLAKQIAAGSPTDMFVSAHQQWTDYLKIGGIIEELLITKLASNSLVVIGSPSISFKSMHDLKSMRHISIGNPVTTAHGQYTMEAIRNAGLEPELKNHFIMDNNRESLQQVENGTIEGAIIYRSEAQQLKKSKILYTISPASHSPIFYQLAVTKASAHDPSTLNFYKFLNSQDAKIIINRHGFTTK
jgi:molybdate transport system substrate-binding protein